MTTYEKLREYELSHDMEVDMLMEVTHKQTKQSGIVRSYGENNELIALYWGADDGSDDTTISIEELNNNFTVGVITMENLVNAITEKLSDMDFMDYVDTMDDDMENLLKDLQLLEKQGNGTLLNAIKMLVEE